MSTAIKCDRCFKYQDGFDKNICFKDPDDTNNFYWYLTIDIKKGNSKKDLCNKCVLEIISGTIQ